MQRFLRNQPQIESFLNKDASLSIELRSNQLHSVIINYYEIELPFGLIRIIISYENNDHVIHHQYQQYVAPKLLIDHYPRKLLYIYKLLNYTSSIITITASFYHLHRWLKQAATINSDTLPSTATITTINNYNKLQQQSISHSNSLPKFLTLFPIPGSLTIFNNITPNLFASSQYYNSLYPSIYTTVPLFALWTGLEFMKNIIFFNTNRNISKLSYFMPVNRETQSITNSLFNDWNEFLYTDNYGLSPKRFIMSYTNDIQYVFSGYDEHNHLIRVDEDDHGTNVNFDEEYETKRNINNNFDDRNININRYNYKRDSIVVPHPKLSSRNNRLPLPNYKHFLFQNNTLFTIIMLHSTLLPVSRALLHWNHFFLPKNNKSNLQSITSHKTNTFYIQNAASKLMKLSNIILSHTYCLLHVVSTSIIPVLGLRSIIFGNMSTQLQNVLNPIHINNNANAANAALAQHQHSDSDDEEFDDNTNPNRNAFEEYIDKWSLSNHLTSISLMLSMVPYVNNFYAMMSVFSFGMTLGEGEDIMRWSAYRLVQNNVGHHNNTAKINKVWYAYYIPWITGVIGITCSFTIEVWASSNNVMMANRFKRISLICLLLSICMSFGNRSYLETGFYLKYTNGRNLFEKMTQYAVEIELGIKNWIANMQERSKRRFTEDSLTIAA
eukprot:343188_1